MTLSAINDSNNKPVDWWFMYKLPENAEAPENAKEKSEPASGYEYLYFDSETKGDLALSDKTLEDESNALQQTLRVIYEAQEDLPPTLGWICYNDEKPDGTKDSSTYGHTKGVLAFDLESDTAFWLLHSWPKFPNVETGELAVPNYGQTYICITLQDVETARYIAEQMYHRQEPQTYQCHLPSDIKEDDIFYRVANAIDVNETDPPCDIAFFSKDWHPFRLMAKNRHWNKDFWIDLVGPHLQVDVDVETWRRGTVPPEEDIDGKDETKDILHIDLTPLGVNYQWHYTKDHAKWGVSETDDWVCVADINRMTSQAKRGGGAICFRNKKLWECLRKIELLKDPDADKHKRS